jgi:hypothetical protein
VPKRRKKPDGDDRALTFRPVGARPDVAPRGLGDEILERTVKAVLAGLHAVDMLVAKHSATGGHAFLEAISAVWRHGSKLQQNRRTHG